MSRKILGPFDSASKLPLDLRGGPEHPIFVEYSIVAYNMVKTASIIAVYLVMFVATISSSSNPTPTTSGQDPVFTWPTSSMTAVGSRQTTLLTVSAYDHALGILSIPAGALPEGTKVSLKSVEIRSDWLVNRGARLAFEVDLGGAKLVSPATLTAWLPNDISLSRKARFFFLRPDNKISSVPRPKFSGNSISASLYHASTIVLAEISKEDIPTKLQSNSIPSSPATGLAFLEWAETIVVDYGIALTLGDEAYAQNLRKQFSEALQSQIKSDASQLNKLKCDPNTGSLLHLLQLGQEIGAVEGVDKGIVQAIATNSARCIRNGRLEILTTVQVSQDPFWPSWCPYSFSYNIPFISGDNGILFGSARPSVSYNCPLRFEEGEMVLRFKNSWQEELTGNIYQTGLGFRHAVLNQDGEHQLSALEYASGKYMTVYGAKWNSGYIQTVLFNIPAMEVKEIGLCHEAYAWVLTEKWKIYSPPMIPETTHWFTAWNYAETCQNPKSEIHFPLQDGSTWSDTVVFNGGHTLITNTVITLRFDNDACDKDKIEQVCRSELNEMIRMCANLEDWMVVSHVGADSPVRNTCATPDCAGPIKRAEEEAKKGKKSKPFASITKTLDKSCGDKAQVICQLECYGWPRQ